MTLQDTPAEPNTFQGDASSSQRLIIYDLLTDADVSQPDGKDVVEGLLAQPKSLPPKYFYDERGSQLFEQICELPEYYPTRTETAILQQYAGAIAQLTGPCEIVELGSGSATKTRILFDAYQMAGYPLRYVPIDVSGTMLAESTRHLLAEYPTMQIQGLVSTYELALAHLPPAQLPARMLCFLGSTLGNFQTSDRDQFLSQISKTLKPGDYFLLGLDLQKETAILDAAYNDSQGITAAFNLNMLHHLNHRFEGNFSVENFAHIARYNLKDAQIEMYLESLKSQTVHLKALNLTADFSAGERLLSEISRKFNLGQMAQTLAAYQLSVVKTLTDENRWFGLVLCQRVKPSDVSS